MFKKILIANRGEIAVRIIRTCKEMNIKTVAIFSESDRTSPHVLKADEAYCVGGSLSSKSYLNVKKIIDTIKKTAVDAVHPGYGFLSENSDFAGQIAKTGATWIGPSPKIINIMGDKIKARQLAGKANIPIVPGIIKPINNLKSAEKNAEKIGYPILIKAAGGGGGKGMRIIHSKSDLKNAIDRSKSEAKKSFADDRVYMEKYLEEPHHIEVQVFADNYGNIVSMGERECSIQRRYQKIIEETPSPFINSNLRQKLSLSAVQLTKACNYSGAGTIEFLVDKYQNYYFLEMNTRLQVEHPITEMVTGVDIVKEQIQVAAGKKLSFSQKIIQFRGHSIECRIYAEDGFDNFSPSTGIINEMTTPQGLGVRLDEGVRTGQQITPYYDPLLAKLITWGSDRDMALSRMYRALSEFHIVGIESTVPFCKMVLMHPTFQKGKYSTNTLDSIKEELLKEISIQRADNSLAARIGAVKFYNQSKGGDKSIDKNITVSQWVAAGRQEGLE